DPPGLARADDTNLVVPHVGPRRERRDRTRNISGEKVEVPVVSRAACALRLADAALVVAEHGDAGADELGNHAGEAQAACRSGAVDPHDGRVRTSARW